MASLDVKLPTEHYLTFVQRGSNKLDWQGRCSCGWLKYGTHAEVINEAARHDLDQYDVKP